MQRQWCRKVPCWNACHCLHPSHDLATKSVSMMVCMGRQDKLSALYVSMFSWNCIFLFASIWNTAAMYQWTLSEENTHWSMLFASDLVKRKTERHRRALWFAKEATRGWTFALFSQELVLWALCAHPHPCVRSSSFVPGSVVAVLGTGAVPVSLCRGQLLFQLGSSSPIPSMCWGAQGCQHSHDRGCQSSSALT